MLEARIVAPEWQSIRALPVQRIGALESRQGKGFVDKGWEMAISLAAQSPDVHLWTLACAQVAELVDALASGASGRKVVEVRVFSWAPFWGIRCRTCWKAGASQYFTAGGACGQSCTSR